MAEDNPNIFCYTERDVINTKNFETYTIRAQESLNTKLIVKFKDGESAEYTEAHSLQEVFDKMQKLHEIEKKLDIAKEALSFYANQENKCFNSTEWHDWGEEYATVVGDIENGYKARQALTKIEE